MLLEIVAAAERELDDAVDWYQSQQEGLQRQFLNEFRSAVRRISAQPDLYVEIRPDTRRGLLNRFPFSIIYEQSGDILRILAVAHQHRKPFYWLDAPR